MSRIKYRIFDGIAEIISHSFTTTGELELEFDRGVTGYVRVGKQTKRLKEGKCSFTANGLPENKIEPMLILGDAEITLPGVVRTGLGFSPAPPDDEYIRSLSLRTLELSRRVKALEECAREMEKKIYGTTIF